MTATNDTRLESERQQSGRSRTLLWVLLGLLVAALVVGVVVAATRAPVRLDPESPEGVVQSYLEAVLDRDYGRAAEYLSAETAERCPPSLFREAWIPDDVVADLDEVRLRDENADVRVQIRTTAEPLPFEALDTSIETFVLIDEDGSWRIDGAPWPLYSCTRPE